MRGKFSPICPNFLAKEKQRVYFSKIDPKICAVLKKTKKVKGDYTMKLLVFVLNKIEKLNGLLNEFADHNIHGATIINSNGMAHSLVDSDDHKLFASFRQLLDPKRKESKTIFMVVNEDEIDLILHIIEKVVGNIESPDTGIVFTLPVDFARGLVK